MKKYLKFILPIIVIALVIYLWQLSPSIKFGKRDNNVVNGPSVVYVDFSFDPGNITSLEYPYTNESKESVFAITKHLSEQQNWPFAFEDYGEMGILITQIRYKNNGDNNKYWQYQVNGKTPMVAANDYFPEARDHIEWKFQESKF